MKNSPTRRSILIVIIIALILMMFLSINKRLHDKQTLPEVTPNSSSRDSFHDIKPGETNSSEVIKILGEPRDRVEQEDTELLIYDSPLLRYDNHVVVDENDKAILIKEQINILKDEKYVSNYTDTPITNAVIRYSKEYDSTLPIYIFPEEGQAFVAHISDQKVFEYWRFTPSDITNIDNTWARDFSPEPKVHF